MKRVAATEARKRWFRLLDEVVAGEVVVVERKGRNVVLRAEDADSPGAEAEIPDYSKLIRVKNADDADLWHWEWKPGTLIPRTHRRSRRRKPR